MTKKDAIKQFGVDVVEYAMSTFKTNSNGVGDLFSDVINNDDALINILNIAKYKFNHSKSVLQAKAIRLRSLIDNMEVPEKFKNNTYWLLNHLCDKNCDNPMFVEAMQLIVGFQRDDIDDISQLLNPIESSGMIHDNDKDIAETIGFLKKAKQYNVHASSHEMMLLHTLYWTIKDRGGIIK